MSNTLAISVGAILVSLLAVGAARVMVMGRNWMRRGLKIMAAGGVAAVIAFLIGALLNALLTG